MSYQNLKIVYQGWLIKSPSEKKILNMFSLKLKWRKRWFVLHQSDSDYFTLSYYRDNTCSELKGHIKLNQCEQINCGLKVENCKAKHQYMFDIKTPQRTYYLVAESEEDMKKWVHFVHCVCGLKLSTDGENTYSVCPIPCVRNERIPDISTINKYDLPQCSHGAESLYNEVDSINDRNLNLPPVNWLKNPGISQDPASLSVATSLALNDMFSGNRSIIAPPRPPKPPHLLETLRKREKLAEPLTDDIYDFPRSHQIIPPISQPKSHRRHCYKNAPPGQIIIEDAITIKSKIEENETMELEYIDLTNSSHLPIANKSLIFSDRTPPPINRLLKPKPSRQISNTSSKLLPLALTTNPPIVDRSVKPLHLKQYRESSNVDRLQIKCLNHIKSNIRTNLEPSRHYNRDEPSGKILASNKVLSYKANSITSNTHCSKESAQNCDKLHSPVAKNNNSNDNEDYGFSTIDFFRTSALTITRKMAEQERNRSD